MFSGKFYTSGIYDIAVYESSKREASTADTPLILYFYNFAWQSEPQILTDI